MAGRGCTIVVKLLGGSTGDGEVEELSLPVALHSPLQVLKEQLASIVGIPVAAQVLILCNLSDPDRNSDVLLTGREGSTLRSCGIRNGSTLTLHALGISNERKMKLANEAWAKKGAQAESEEHRITLSTEITAAEANHRYLVTIRYCCDVTTLRASMLTFYSYNGVIFDVQSHGPYEVLVHSVSIAGMLGRVVRRITAMPHPSCPYRCIAWGAVAYLCERPALGGEPAGAAVGGALVGGERDHRAGRLGVRGGSHLLAIMGQAGRGTVYCASATTLARAVR